MVAEKDNVRDIAIYDGATEQERRRCRVVGLPDGRDGVFWRGLIYPLRGDLTVDISGEAFPPSSISDALGKSARSGAAPSCALVDGDQESWLLVAGSAADQASMAMRLRGAGIEIVRTGRYLGEPADGVSADWYIRTSPLTGTDPFLLMESDPASAHRFVVSGPRSDPRPALKQSFLCSIEGTIPSPRPGFRKTWRQPAVNDGLQATAPWRGAQRR
jgi:hypothetical protein